MIDLYLSLHVMFRNTVPLSASGSGGNGVGHQTVKHRNRGVGGDRSWQYTRANGSSCCRQMIPAFPHRTDGSLRHFLSPHLPAQPNNHSPIFWPFVCFFFLCVCVWTSQDLTVRAPQQSAPTSMILNRGCGQWRGALSWWQLKRTNRVELDCTWSS